MVRRGRAPTALRMRTASIDHRRRRRRCRWRPVPVCQESRWAPSITTRPSVRARDLGEGVGGGGVFVVEGRGTSTASSTSVLASSSRRMRLYWAAAITRVGTPTGAPEKRVPPAPPITRRVPPSRWLGSTVARTPSSASHRLSSRAVRRFLASSRARSLRFRAPETAPARRAGPRSSAGPLRPRLEVPGLADEQHGPAQLALPLLEVGLGLELRLQGPAALRALRARSPALGERDERRLLRGHQADGGALEAPAAAEASPRARGGRC